VSCELASSLSRREKGIVDGHETIRPTSGYLFWGCHSTLHEIDRWFARLLDPRISCLPSCVRGSSDNCRIVLETPRIPQRVIDTFYPTNRRDALVECQGRCGICTLSSCSGCATPVEFYEPWRPERQSTTYRRGIAAARGWELRH